MGAIYQSNKFFDSEKIGFFRDYIRIKMKQLTNQLSKRNHKRSRIEDLLSVPFNSQSFDYNLAQYNLEL